MRRFPRAYSHLYLIGPDATAQEQFTPAALSDLGSDVRALLCDDEQTPMRNTLRLVQSVNKAEKADCADGAQLARECVKTVYVHLVPVGDGQDLKSKQMWTFKGKLAATDRSGCFPHTD